jgi:hypothetical protein
VILNEVQDSLLLQPRSRAASTSEQTRSKVETTKHASSGWKRGRTNLQVREALARRQQAEAAKNLTQQLAMVLRTGKRANQQVRSGASGH